MFDTDTNDEYGHGRTTADAVATEEAAERAHSDIRTFLRGKVADAGASGAVVAMSGGIDSTVTATLAADALGPDRVLGLGMPCTKVDSAHAAEARTVAEDLGIEFREVQLRPLLDMFEDVVAPTVAPAGDKDAVGNAIARLRMACTYYAANARSRLVVGTANRSELLLGYFTKHGDGAADLYPIGDLYKTEVRTLARHLDVPPRIIEKEPTAGLWAGQTDEAEIGAGYDAVDPLLRRLVDEGERVERAADEAGVDVETAERVAAMYVDTLHKRTVPPTPGVRGGNGKQPSYSLHLADEVRRASDGGD
ncbi:NAD+ synthase [Halostella litorea]|uniref:NAD+ synthase n=1 Tax=Halostella litorea TaxID=2528831 RepID=UPI0010920742|nr:NAD+ synthase [Halostella litorea]